jgi:molybdopterin-binding protein
MKISARDKLKGTVESIQLGVVTAKIGVGVGENVIESAITRQSVGNSASKLAVSSAR